MKSSFLVIGTAEVGLSMLQSLSKYKDAHQLDIQIAALVKPGTTSIKDLSGNVVLSDIILEPIDLVESRIEELARLFSNYETVICCSGFSIGKGIQVKITEAVLAGGVSRYVPWQFGANYDLIGRGSAQPVFDEQLDVRDKLRAQSNTKWVIVSTGMITSFLFREDFGVVSIEEETIHALGSWDNSLTLTCSEDIGKLTIEILFHQPEIVNEAVLVSGETATFSQIAEHLETLYHKPFKRVLWNEEYLKNAIKNDPDNNFHKYRLVFTDQGVSWPMEKTFNYQQNIPTIGILEWAKNNFVI